MTKEQFIRFIKSKGYVNLSGNRYKNGGISIWCYENEWVINSTLPEIDVDYANLNYPKIEMYAIEFFRILGI